MTTFTTLEKPSHRSLVQLPHSLELFHLFQEFLLFWTGFQVGHFGRDPVAHLENPMEFTVRWVGSLKGALVVRSSARLVEKLWSRAQDRGMEFRSREDLFQEMVTLYSIFLARSLDPDEFMELGPFLARSSTPKDWPVFSTNSLCAIEIEGEPIEIRLWLDPAATSALPQNQGVPTC